MNGRAIVQYLGIWLIPIYGFRLAEAVTSNLTHVAEVLTHTALLAVIFICWFWCLSGYVKFRLAEYKKHLTHEVFEASKAVDLEGETYLMFPTDIERQREFAAINRSVTKIWRAVEKGGAK
ncbi:hypothetical protein [Oricola sp.]|uniref:hypothetical protein n=1 Tax=Oricola sp. TaxID=1979950 RepID=UPI003BAAB27E